MKRQVIELTPSENAILRGLAPVQGTAFKFWKAVCADRGLDHKTVLAQINGQITALELGHGKYWNYPYALQCKNPPPEEVIRA